MRPVMVTIITDRDVVRVIRAVRKLVPEGHATLPAADFHRKQSGMPARRFGLNLNFSGSMIPWSDGE